LIGLRGNGIVCHGKSNPDAISYGVGFAQKAADEKWAERMSEGMLAYQANLK